MITYEAIQKPRIFKTGSLWWMRIEVKKGQDTLVGHLTGLSVSHLSQRVKESKMRWRVQ